MHASAPGPASRRLLVTGLSVLGLLLSLSPGAAAGVTVKKTVLVTIPATFEVKAPVAQVWKTATSLAGFGALTGFVPDPSAAGGAFAALGNAFPATVWTDKGMLIATLFAREKELRVTWEPAGGGYLCAKRIVLTPVPGGTRVEYWDRYTDDQANVDQTAASVAKETDTGIEKFKALLGN